VVLVLLDFMMKHITILNKNLSSISDRSLIFDLDNTIFDENIFLNQGYFRISQFINSKYGIDVNEVHNFLWAAFMNGSRSSLFNRMLKHFNLEELVSIENLLAVFRNIENQKLVIFKYFQIFLMKNINFYIITNGNRLQQVSKFIALDLHNYSQCLDIIFAESLALKPNTDSYDFLRKKWVLNKPIYIGDSSIDEEFSKNCNIDLIKINFDRNESGFIIEESISFEMIINS
jgi:putative hydrolase of the HAD superfamily